MASTNHGLETVWTKCFLCQIDNDEQLVNLKCVYETLFHSLNVLPMPLNLKRLDDGSGLETTLKDNHAKDHNSCRLFFNNSKLSRIRQKCESSKRKTSLEFLEESSRLKRKLFENQRPVCFICEKEDSIVDQIYAKLKPFRDVASYKKLSHN